MSQKTSLKFELFYRFVLLNPTYKTFFVRNNSTVTVYKYVLLLLLLKLRLWLQSKSPDPALRFPLQASGTYINVKRLKDCTRVYSLYLLS